MSTDSTRPHLFKDLRAYLLPSKEGFALTTIGSLLITLIFSVRTGLFSNPLNNLSTGAVQRLSDTYGTIIDAISSIWEFSGTALLWFVIGGGIYVVIWTLLVFGIDGYNDLVISRRFVHPKSFHQSTYWLAIVGRFAFRFFAIVFLVGYISVVTKESNWQLLTYTLRDTTASTTTVVTVAYYILTWVFVMCIAHIGIILYRFARLRSVDDSTYTS